LGFTVTLLVHLDTVTISAGPFSFRVAATNLGVVLFEASEAAEVFTFIGLIGTLSLTITIITQVDTITVVALPFIILAAAFLVVVEFKVFEAAVLVALIRSISTLGFSVTESALKDAISVSTLPLVSETTALLIVVE
jgi:hypothetical protein